MVLEFHIPAAPCRRAPCSTSGPADAITVPINYKQLATAMQQVQLWGYEKSLAKIFMNGDSCKQLSADISEKQRHSEGSRWDRTEMLIPGNTGLVPLDGTRRQHRVFG